MLKALLNSAATIPIAAFLMLLGIASFIACATALSVQYFHFMNSGYNITAPNDTLTLEVVPNTQYAIYHRITGTHVTENRPEVAIPDSIQIDLLAADNDQPIDMTPSNWFMRSSFFGLRTKRQAIREFIAPDSASVTLQVSGLDDETVFYVGRTHRVFNDTIFPFFLAGLVATLLVIIFAAAIIINRIVKTTPELRITQDQI